MGYIDLHVHSTESDGTMPPRELVQYACEKGLSAFALTDHDTVKGVGPALITAEYLPVTVIPGVELTSLWDDHNIHVLGYFIDHNNPDFVARLEEISMMRTNRNYKMCELLQKQGFNITMDELLSRHSSININRANIADLMAEKGYVRDHKEAFDKYIGRTCPCFIPSFKISIEEAADLIASVGGVSVIAHPVKYGFSNDEYYELFHYAKVIGIHGIEALYSENTFNDEVKFKDYARKLDMFITGGSDYHGMNKPAIDMGTGKGNLMVPDTLLDNIRRTK
ncbi:MAG: PHP domain-containing protein [Lachnospiraceae bacterium]|nr:PHP domain-containing protein [Lachnospiraceae bacterium]